MFLLLLLAMAVLAGPTFLGAQDLEANSWKVLPEAIWSSAEGGGTWVTEVQITAISSGDTPVNVYFYYNGGMRGPFLLTTLAQYHTYRTTNLLNAIDGLDGGVFTYYGRVGAVWFWTSGGGNIHVTAKTVNGTYGKTLPAWAPTLNTTAAVGRPMMIPLMYNGSVNRSACGFFNTSLSTSITATFYLISPTFGSYGSFVKTFPAGDFQAFNPFIHAGISAGVYTNCWLYIVVTAGPDSTTTRGLMGFGSVVNNTSNDPAALIAYPFILQSTTASTDPPLLSTGDPRK
ncbi:MAG: hypothetical protein L6428_06895 [Candidatus Aminicenantes bacterium]|nr:hypothetical protein [Acidobacteriota bacterium]MCG2811168.1 hypothetical protein [Candidatus Aminicenantes bacterium]